MINSSSKDVHVPLRVRIDATRQLLEVFRNGEGVQILSGIDFKIWSRL